jgi:hypothetical protein
VTDRILGASELDISALTESGPVSEVQNAVVAVSTLVDELAYHGESYLMTTYDLQDRLTSLLGVLCRCSKEELTGFRGAYNEARIPRYHALRKSMPDVANEFLALEDQLCEFVRLRNKKTHWASLHFAVLVNGQPFQPDDTLSGIKGDRTWFLELIQERVRRFARRHKEAADSIAGSVNRLAEGVRIVESVDR